MNDKKICPSGSLIASKSGPGTGIIVHDFPRERRRIDVIIDVFNIEQRCSEINNKRVKDER